MVQTKGCIVFQEVTNSLNFQTHKLLKSGSNESFKLQNHKMNPLFRTRFKTFKEESELEDNKFAVTLWNEELLDHNNCTWLSSGGAPSPSSCCQYNGFLGDMDVKIDAWFISLLSKQSPRFDKILSTEITFFDGSRVNPIEEASVVLDQQTSFDENISFHDKLEEAEVVSWLEKESTDINSKWSQSEFAYLEYDSATPISDTVSSFTNSSDKHSQFSLSSSSDHSMDYSSEVMDLEEIGADKPLFWPFNSVSDWNSDTKWDFFIMSPRKDIYKVHKSPNTSRVPNRKPDLEKSCNRRLVFGKNSNPSHNLDPKTANDITGVRRMKNKPSKLKTSNKTRTKTPYNIDSFTDTENEHLLHASETASFEGFSTKTPVFWPSSCVSEWSLDTKWDFLVISPRKTSPKSLKLQVINGNMDLEKGCSRRLEFSTMELPKVESLTKKSMVKHKIVLEDLLLVDKLNVEGAIEQVLGLGEFDGHEGIDSEFNKDEFSLVQIP